MTIPRDLLSTDWVKTRGDFIEFLELLNDEFDMDGQNWENVTLQRFLSAMVAYSDDIQGRYENIYHQDADMPTWKIFAEIIIGSSMYE